MFLFFIVFIFLFFFDKGLFTWSVAQSACCTLSSELPTVLLAWRHLDTMVLTNFENLNYISNILQEAHVFLVLTDPSNYLHLFKDNQQTFPWTGERTSSHLKVSKMWFGQNIKRLSESFFADFWCQEGISCFFFVHLFCPQHI